MLTILASWAQIRKPDFIIILFVLSALFGASAAITLHFLGGRPIQPVTFMLPFILLYTMRMPRAIDQIKQALIHDNAVTALVAFTIIAITVSIFSPVFLSGEILVYNVEKGKFILKALEFSSSHIAQIIYLLGSVTCFIVVVGLSRTETGIDGFSKALILLTVLNALFGVIDLVTFYLGYSEALMFLKNAGYAMVDQNMHGVRRISGAFPETSAFSRFSVSLLAFNLALFLRGYYRRYTGPLSLITASLLIITTSSSAYLGLIGVAIMVLWIEKERLTKGLISKSLFWVGFIACVFSALLFIIFNEEVISIFNSAVVEKMDSESGIERMSWNKQAWNNFVDSGFWGVGLGGNRASSLIMVVLSNVGIIGLGSYLLFLAFALKGRSVSLSPEKNVVAAAAKSAALVTLLPAMATATSFFSGMLFYILLGLGSSTVGLRALSSRE